MLVLALLIAVGEPRSIAVLEFKNKLVNEQLDTSYLTDQVRGAALGAGTPLRVITRENLLALLAATGKDLSNCEGECEVETGRRIGADLVISGELLKFGSSYKVDMRLHDTKEASLLSAATASGATVDELDRNLAAAVQKLLAPLSADAPRPQAQTTSQPLQLGLRPTRLLGMSIDNGEIQFHLFNLAPSCRRRRDLHKADCGKRDMLSQRPRGGPGAPQRHRDCGYRAVVRHPRERWQAAYLQSEPRRLVCGYSDGDRRRSGGRAHLLERHLKRRLRQSQHGPAGRVHARLRGRGERADRRSSSICSSATTMR